MSLRILIIGACSGIAQAVASRYATRGARFVLVARDSSKLEAVAADLRARGAEETCCKILDVMDYETHKTFAQEVTEQFNGLDHVLLAHGILPNQEDCESDWKQAKHAFEVNCLTVISLLEQFAGHSEEGKIGSLAVIGSVAGDRGRQSNYFYGAAKGAVEIYLSGLRNRLQPAGVSVLLIKPGFVDTPMTTEFDKGLLWAQPESVAKKIERALDSKKDVIYVPGFWRLIMFIIRSIPERIFKRLKL